MGEHVGVIVQGAEADNRGRAGGRVGPGGRGSRTRAISVGSTPCPVTYRNPLWMAASHIRRPTACTCSGVAPGLNMGDTSMRGRARPPLPPATPLVAPDGVGGTGVWTSRRNWWRMWEQTKNKGGERDIVGQGRGAQAEAPTSLHGEWGGECTSGVQAREWQNTQNSRYRQRSMGLHRQHRAVSTLATHHPRVVQHREPGLLPLSLEFHHCFKGVLTAALWCVGSRAVLCVCKPPPPTATPKKTTKLQA